MRHCPPSLLAARLAPALALSLGLASLAGCDRKDETLTRPSPAPSAQAGQAAQAAQPAHAQPAASAQAAAPTAASGSAQPRKRRGPPKDLAQVSSELGKACLPKKDAENNLEMKTQAAETNECMRKKMNASLDEVLLPLKKSDPARFKALMKEQATWNKYVAVACHVTEELAWLNFDDGMRDDGTMRGYAFMGCMDNSLTERVLYARSLASGDATALAKHVDEVQKKGAEAKALVADRKQKATKWVVTPPKPTNDYGTPGEWKDFYQATEQVQQGATELAKASCQGFSQLATALGGEQACESKLEAYYLTQSVQPPDNEGQ